MDELKKLPGRALGTAIAEATASALFVTTAPADAVREQDQNCGVVDQVIRGEQQNSKLDKGIQVDKATSKIVKR